MDHCFRLNTLQIQSFGHRAGHRAGHSSARRHLGVCSVACAALCADKTFAFRCPHRQKTAALASVCCRHSGSARFLRTESEIFCMKGFAPPCGFETKLQSNISKKTKTLQPHWLQGCSRSARGTHRVRASPGAHTF